MAAGCKSGSVKWLGRFGENDGVTGLGFRRRSRQRRAREHATCDGKSRGRCLRIHSTFNALGWHSPVWPGCRCECRNAAVNRRRCSGQAFNTEREYASLDYAVNAVFGRYTIRRHR